MPNDFRESVLKRMQSKINYVLAAGLVIILTILIIRNFGLNATVFGDEYVQSMHSRYYMPSQFTWPNFLYFRIFSITSAFGEGYLEAARILNSLFWVLGCIPIFLIARRVLSEGQAVIAALLSALLPSNIYTAFFMPEALFFFTVWWLFLWMIRLGERPTKGNLVISVILFALVSLIKPHVLFLIPTIFIFYLYKFGLQDWKRTTVLSLLAIISSLSFKLLLGFFLAGPAGLTLFGGTYSGFASSGADSLLRLTTVFTSGFRLAPAHLLAFALVFGLVAISAIQLLIQSRSTKPQNLSTRDLTVFSLCSLINFIIASSIFTSLVAGMNELELNNRIHERYYFYLFPFFVILALSFLKKETNDFDSWKTRLAVAQLPLFGLALAAVGFFSSFSIQWVDQPEYFALLLFPIVACLWALINLVNLIYWVVRPVSALKIFSFVLLPAYLVASSISGAALLSMSKTETAESLVADALLPLGGGTERISIVGADIISSYRLSFELDNPNSQFLMAKKGEMFNLDSNLDQALVVVQPGIVARNSDKFDISIMKGFTIATRK